MATKIQVTGNIAEPELRYTGSGKAVLDIRVAGTLARKDQHTGQWEDQGAPLWLSAPFWEHDAERLADTLHKGARVTIEGLLTIDAYEANGERREKLVIRNARFLGVIPRQNTQNGYQGAPSATNSASPVPTTGPTGNGGPSDPWATPGQASFDSEPPF